MRKISILDRECDDLVRRYRAVTIDVCNDTFTEELEKLKQDILSFLRNYPDFKTKIESQTSFRIVSLV